MIVKISIEGNPRITQSINYTRKGKSYTPGSGIENEKILRASVVNRLEYDFKPFTGPVSINRLNFSFPPNCSFSKEEKEKIFSGSTVEKNIKPDLADCLNNMLKAITGTLIVNESQICRIAELKKFYSSKPGIILEIEELK